MTQRHGVGLQAQEILLQKFDASFRLLEPLFLLLGEVNLGVRFLAGLLDLFDFLHDRARFFNSSLRWAVSFAAHSFSPLR